MSDLDKQSKQEKRKFKGSVAFSDEKQLVDPAHLYCKLPVKTRDFIMHLST